MSQTPGTLQAIVYTPASSSTSGKPTLQILDQLALPHRTEYLTINGVRDAYEAIKSMSVRGAPAIAIVAALSVVIDISEHTEWTSRKVSEIVVQQLEYLLTSRPTAVNLNDAVVKLSRVVEKAVEQQDASNESVRLAYIDAAERMLVDDVSDNQAIGRYGAQWIATRFCSGAGKVAVLTHCNTGSLATAGYGTALGIIRSLHSASHLSMAYYTETRPYNQGSRLTGYELLHDKIPCTLVTDSMAAALFQKAKSQNEPIAAVIVGADRVAANGDTANKIGTYQLAILAHFHGVKFLVAAPRTTIDLATPSGSQIVIEQRPPEEMLSVRGPHNLGYSNETRVQSVDVNNIASVSTAALGTKCWNPAFDVTPAGLIDGIVTEVGVVEKGPDGKFDLQRLFSRTEKLMSEEKEMPDPLEGP